MSIQKILKYFEQDQWKLRPCIPKSTRFRTLTNVLPLFWCVPAGLSTWSLQALLPDLLLVAVSCDWHILQLPSSAPCQPSLFLVSCCHSGWNLKDLFSVLLSGIYTKLYTAQQGDSCTFSQPLIYAVLGCILHSGRDTLFLSWSLFRLLKVLIIGWKSPVKEEFLCLDISGIYLHLWPAHWVSDDWSGICLNGSDLISTTLPASMQLCALE